MIRAVAVEEAISLQSLAEWCRWRDKENLNTKTVVFPHSLHVYMCESVCNLRVLCVHR